MGAMRDRALISDGRHCDVLPSPRQAGDSIDPVIGATPHEFAVFAPAAPEVAGCNVAIDARSRFRLKDAPMADYAGVLNGGVVSTWVGVLPARTARAMNKWADWPDAKPETVAYLATRQGGHDGQA